ncbi:torulene oxygenase [Verticillium alfalfae VaMs.102]|uniref:Torulene oxygenase n=1 Tax=Verticillium alfalfae (strain VaMs.102 / ATCC MYA-4576 / FGSC 10136) TaxID=526221 RepID=C9SQ32_VERA1|nr:torulene oxygenase [Verticillium alfalfae VaMs.102]EEY20957.1 torulene oxygenase [Verticillium alfalfae VaMs.102]
MGSAAMLAEAAALPGTAPALRTPHDAEADRKEFAQNIAKQTYKEWPNEAGFDGLTEERGPLELTVRGHIPDWAAGSLYRTGPGACKVENSPKGTHYVTHWFDGFAHTHLFQIVPADEAAGTPLRVVYSSRRQARRSSARSGLRACATPTRSVSAGTPALVCSERS